MDIRTIAILSPGDMGHRIGRALGEHGIPLASVNYWLTVPDVVEGLLERQTALHHACEGETPLMLAVAPELVDIDRLREAHGRGDGDGALATAEKGQTLLEAIVERLAETLSGPDFWAAPA